jgi:hypothetical protein
MFGGEGKDTFAIGANSWIEDAEAHDRVTYGGIPIFGGAKQWWMEGNTAAWAPFSTVMSGFPVIGSQILTAAAFFVDVMTMKFASFQRDASGDLVMVLGWGHGGFGIVKDYHLDLDSGVGSGGGSPVLTCWRWAVTKTLGSSALNTKSTRSRRRRDLSRIAYCPTSRPTACGGYRTRRMKLRVIPWFRGGNWI